MSEDKVPEHLRSPTDRTYHLKCTIKRVHNMVRDQKKSGEWHTYRNDLWLLIPEESSQRSLFLSAWLPDTLEEQYELPVMIKPPIDSPARCLIFRAPDKKSDRHYLQVMNKGVTDIFDSANMEGKTILVDALPESQSEAADFAKDDTDYEFEVDV